jgi:hypothetical protein
MANQLAMDYMMAVEQALGETESCLPQETQNVTLPNICQSLSDPTLTTYQRLTVGAGANDSSSDEPRHKVDDTTLPKLPRLSHVRPLEIRHSSSTVEDSPPQSRSSSTRPGLSPTATSTSVYTIETFAGSTHGPSSVPSRLDSSISPAPTSGPTVPRQSIDPSDFRTPPEQPEKRFVDSVGVVCPGVSDRLQCNRHVHFVSTFRICAPIEYSTALADHGVTYTDYCRLLTSIENFLKDHAGDARWKLPQKAPHLICEHQQESLASRHAPHNHGGAFLDTSEQLGRAKRQAHALNQLLEDITSNLRARGLPVVIHISSFSLFPPYRITEGHVQILHAPFATDIQSVSEKPDPRCGQRLSFIDPFSFVRTESRSVSKSRPGLESRSQSEQITHIQCSKHHHQAFQYRDRSKPWPLWPNAIPTRKRQAMLENADRYGADPFYRAYLRANINARTTSSTYAEYMIEQEDDPFVNRRLKYTGDASRGALALDANINNPKSGTKHSVSSCVRRNLLLANRARYEHNRRLECRKNVEQGSRLRIIRFGFRHAIFPVPTPEMEELGLTKARYETIISNIAGIRTSAQLCTKCPVSYLLSAVNTVRRRSTGDALLKVSQYIRELNASQRRVVWTIEKIPGVYDRGLARDRSEWEISVWNGSDPLELLIELERWGIIEQGLNSEDDE